MRESAGVPVGEKMVRELIAGQDPCVTARSFTARHQANDHRHSIADSAPRHPRENSCAESRLKSALCGHAPETDSFGRRVPAAAFGRAAPRGAAATPHLRGACRLPVIPRAGARQAPPRWSQALGLLARNADASALAT